LRQVVAVFGGLRGRLGDVAGEVGFCRQRLDGLLAEFRRDDADARSGPAGAGGFLLPAGCPSVDAAVNRLLDGVTADDLRELDRRAQAAVQAQFTSLAHACLNAADLRDGLGGAVRQAARE